MNTRKIMQNVNKIDKRLRKHVIEVNELEGDFNYLLQTQKDNYSIKSLIVMSLEYITLLDILKENISEKVLNEDEELIESIEYVKKLIDNYKVWFSNENNEDIISNLNNIKNKICKRVKVLTAYRDTIKMYDFLLNKMSIKFLLKKERLNEVDDSTLISQILMFIANDKNMSIMYEKLKIVLRFLPVRITRQKLYDYVSKSMHRYIGTSVYDLDNLIEFIIDAFYPQGVEGYGQFFKFIADDLKKFDNISFENIDEIEANNLLSHTIQINENINILLNICSYTIRLINQLISLIIRNDISFDNLINKESAINAVIEIWEMVNQMTNDNINDFVMSEDIIARLTRLEGKQEKWMEYIARCSSAIEICMEHYSDAIKDLGLSDEFEIIRKINLLNSDNLFVDIEKDKHIDIKNEVADSKFIKEKSNKIIEFIDYHLKGLPQFIYKSKIAQLFDILPIGFTNTDEIHAYIENSIELCNDKYEKLAVMYIIKDIMDKL